MYDDPEPRDDAWVPPLTFWLVVVAVVLAVASGIAVALAPDDRLAADPWLAGFGTLVLVLVVGSLLIIAASLEKQNRGD
jgi:hypothetical protein